MTDDRGFTSTTTTTELLRTEAVFCAANGHSYGAVQDGPTLLALCSRCGDVFDVAERYREQKDLSA